MRVSRANEPTDVYWENLHVSLGDRAWRTFKTWFWTILVLILVLIINVGVAYFKQFLESLKDENSSGANDALFWIITIITLAVSLITAFVNVILGRIVRIFSAYEKHHTYSNYNLSVASKLTIGIFINTGIIPLLANIIPSQWFDNSGIVMDVTFKILAVGFISPIFYVCNLGSCIKWCQLNKERLKGKNSRMTQLEANLLSEGPAIDMA